MSDLYENIDLTNFPPPLNVASEQTIRDWCKLDAEGFQRLLDLKAIRPWGIQTVEFYTPGGSAKFEPENSDRENVDYLFRKENARRLANGLDPLPVPTTPTKAFSQGVTIETTPAVIHEQPEPGNGETTDPTFTGTEPDLDDLTEAQLEELTRPAEAIPATDETQPSE